VWQCAVRAARAAGCCEAGITHQRLPGWVGGGVGLACAAAYCFAAFLCTFEFAMWDCSPASLRNSRSQMSQWIGSKEAGLWKRGRGEGPGGGWRSARWLCRADLVGSLSPQWRQNQAEIEVMVVWKVVRFRGFEGILKGVAAGDRRTDQEVRECASVLQCGTSAPCRYDSVHLRSELVGWLWTNMLPESASC